MPSWFPHNLAETVVFVPLRIAFLILVAVLVRGLLHRFLNRTIARAAHTPPPPRFRAAQAFMDATTLPAARRAQRVAALGSLGKSAVTFLVAVVTGLTVLSELGFDITTIVAGTSVIAVTIAFGVQSIVKDLISGVFMLVEDQLGVGDFVDMDKASGVVESIGLRVTQLRDDDGTQWYVRNGEVLRVGNYSQGGLGRPPVVETPAPTPAD
ncbi:MAG: putative MscS family transporter [Friedmanniella sp.]|nr:putative MscS family transporter [Friedmanniella sp.]